MAPEESCGWLTPRATLRAPNSPGSRCRLLRYRMPARDRMLRSARQLQRTLGCQRIARYSWRPLARSSAVATAPSARPYAADQASIQAKSTTLGRLAVLMAERGPPIIRPRCQSANPATTTVTVTAAPRARGQVGRPPRATAATPSSGDAATAQNAQDLKSTSR